MRRHWRWRPGRRQYAWHLTFGEQTVLRGRAQLLRVAGACQARLAGLPGLDLVPAEWLHLTVQPVGFADEVAGAVRAGIAEVWGPARVPEAAGGFVPHVSLAYSNTDGPSEP
jgi:hypothetical protein